MPSAEIGVGHLGLLVRRPRRQRFPARPSITNFVGYVTWWLWLIAMAVVRWRSRVEGDSRGVRIDAAQEPALR